MNKGNEHNTAPNVKHLKPMLCGGNMRTNPQRTHLERHMQGIPSFIVGNWRRFQYYPQRLIPVQL